MSRMIVGNSTTNDSPYDPHMPFLNGKKVYKQEKCVSTNTGMRRQILLAEYFRPSGGKPILPTYSTHVLYTYNT